MASARLNFGAISRAWAVKTNLSAVFANVSSHVSAVRGFSSSAAHTDASNDGQVRTKRDEKRLHADRELLLSVLSASTTKRDAKAYLSKYRPEDDTADKFSATQDGPRVALVLLRGMGSLDEQVVNGVTKTFSQLTRLGLHIVIVVDPAIREDTSESGRRSNMITQADHLVTLLQNENNIRARRLDYVLGMEKTRMHVQYGLQERINVEHRSILLSTIKNETIPVIPPIAYLKHESRNVEATPEEVLVALAKELTTGSRSLPQPGRTGSSAVPDTQCNVDRVIILDPLGGLPSLKRPDKAHVFVNLEQEYMEIKDELLAQLDRPNIFTTTKAIESEADALLSSNPLSKFADEEIDSLRPRESNETLASGADRDNSVAAGHLKNLRLLQQCLSILPPSSSALLTTPLEAATLQASQPLSTGDLGVITRRPKNPLIFNLLTNKPTISSSLPVSRYRPQQSDLIESSKLSPATFFKKGMALTIIPDLRKTQWRPPSASGPKMSLEDSRIDFPRLLNLIEDSFNRPLDVEHYLNRVRNRIAGVIVAGEYEGGAILTWELPPGVPDDGSEESASRMVPYLDKFAVLKRSQGSGGVADIVFSAMVRTCFPHGVCWRSRKNNPVNKWYFDRSIGTWKLPETEWSMFWTTPGLLDDAQRLADYEGVCRAILPSWADRKHVVD